MPKIEPSQAPFRQGTDYPAPHDAPVRDRRRWRLGDVAGLTAFGVNRLELDPGVWSSQRHHHSLEDEFVVVLEGEVTLIEDEGETVLKAGDLRRLSRPVRATATSWSTGRTGWPWCWRSAAASRWTPLSIPTSTWSGRAGGPWYAHRDGRPYPEG